MLVVVWMGSLFCQTKSINILHFVEYLHFTFIDISMYQLKNTNGNVGILFISTVNVTVKTDEYKIVKIVVMT